MKHNDSTLLERVGYPFACAVILLVLIFTKIPYLFIDRIWPDEALYGWYADRVFADPFFIFSQELMYPPLFPALLASGKLFFSGDIAFRFILLIFMVLGVTLVYVLGTRASGARFVGAFCALGLAFNVKYFFVGTLILIDGPLVVFFTLLALALLNVHARSSKSSDIYVGLAGGAIILLKWSSVLLLPIVVGYYFLGLNEIPWRRRLSRVMIPLGMCAAVWALLLTKNYIHLGRFFPSLTALSGAYFIEPWDFYFKQLPLLLGNEFAVLFFVGLPALFRKSRRVTVLLLGWLLTFWVVLSFVPEKDARYILPVVPCMLVIGGIGLEYLVGIFFRKERWTRFCVRVVVLIIFAVFAAVSYQKVVYFEQRSTYAYTGFSEAGRWLKENVPSGAVVFVGSNRALRYYSGLDYKEAGGPLERIPESPEEFGERARAAAGPVFLEVDAWEYTQPDWLYPFTQAKYDRLVSMGFEPVKTVKRPAISGRKAGRYNVVWIFYQAPE